MSYRDLQKLRQNEEKCFKQILVVSKVSLGFSTPPPGPILNPQCIHPFTSSVHNLKIFLAIKYFSKFSNRGLPYLPLALTASSLTKTCAPLLWLLFVIQLVIIVHLYNCVHCQKMEAFLQLTVKSQVKLPIYSFTR